MQAKIATIAISLDSEALDFRIPIQEDCSAGAVAAFIGKARRTSHFPGKRIVRGLFYEAATQLAINSLTAIATEVADECALTAVSVHHRVGFVPCGAPSIVVVAEAKARGATFAAIPQIVDRIKGETPIWKKEVFDDQEARWIHPIS